MSSDKKNSIWLSFQFVVKLVFALFALKINLENFGNELFGTWLLFASIWGFSSTLDFGFATSIVKFVAEHKEDEVKVSKILSSSILVFICLGFLIFSAGFVIGYLLYISNDEIIQLGQKSFFINVFLLLGIAFNLQYLTFFFKAVIEGLSKFVISSRIIILESIIYLAGVGIIYYLSMPILYLSILYIIIFTISLLIYLYVFFFRIKKYLIRLSFFDLKEVKRVLSFSMSVQAMSIFHALIDPLIKYVIGVHYTIALVPAYEIARRFAISISGLFFNAFKIILPKASALKSDSNKIDFVKNEVVNYCKYGIIYSGVSFGILALPISLLIKIVFGNEEAILVFLILALPESINNFGFSIYNFLLGIGKVNFLALIQLNNLIFVVVGIYLGFILLNNPLGLLGYFFSVILANVALLLYLQRQINISIAKLFLTKDMTKLITLVVLMSVTMIFYHLGTFDYWILFSSLSLVSLLIFIKDAKTIYQKILGPYLKFFPN